MTQTLNEWFDREILAHERALAKFVARVWSNRSEIDDLCQETFVRVYESAAKSLPQSPRGFLFATARHLMADRIRRGKIVSIEMRGDLELLNVLIDEISPEQQVSARQELWLLAQAFSTLPQKCRDVMWLIKVEELTRKQTAERLNISVKAVEKRIERGVKLLEAAYFGSGAGGDSDAHPTTVKTGGVVESGPDHG